MAAERSEQLVLAAEPQAVRRARSRLRETLEEVGVDDARQRDALLVLSELITNAIEHGSGENDQIEVSWVVTGSRLRVCVGDAARARRTPVVLTPDEERPKGRGLRIADQLADRWDERIVGGRREVTFSIEL